MKTLKDELDVIALGLAKDIQGDVPFDAKLDAFKVLSAYHLGLMKKGGQPPADGGSKAFSAIVENIRKAG